MPTTRSNVSRYTGTLSYFVRFEFISETVRDRRNPSTLLNHNVSKKSIKKKKNKSHVWLQSPNRSQPVLCTNDYCIKLSEGPRK